MAEVESHPANPPTPGNAYGKSDTAIDRQAKLSEDYSSPKSVVRSQPISASPPSPASSFSETRPDTQAQSAGVNSDIGQIKGPVEQPGYEIVPVQKPATERDAPPSPSSLLSTTGDTRGVDRDVLLAKAHQEKVMKYIEAWQVHEKAIIANKYQKEVMKINAWVQAEKAKVEAGLKKAEAKLEKKKAKIHEQLLNEIAAIQRNGEERKAELEIKHVEEVVKIEEKAARFRATGKSPKRSTTCFQMLKCKA